MKKSILLLALVVLQFISYGQNYNLQLRSNLKFNPDLNDIWGMNHSNGNEYALVGLTIGIAVVDVTNPDQITPIYSINGAFSPWRDLKSFGDYAYGVTEGREGLTIIDLTNPASPKHKFFTDNNKWSSSHNCYIDQDKGFLYVFGADFAQGKVGVLMYDLNVDPYNPVFKAFIPTPYVHDGFAKGNNLYLANINDGFFTIFNINKPTQPILLSTKSTPRFFSHNIWTNANETLAFTTDEKSGAGITAYDISDKSNPIFKDNIQSDPSSQPIVHNVHVQDNYVITSYYSNGVTIHDASVPDKLAEVGYYDTSPFRNSNFNGAWGAFPFLNSGNILVSDIEQGLFVLTPTYQRAADFNGEVVDKETGELLNTVLIEIIRDGHNVTNWVVNGVFSDRLLASNYQFTVSREGYKSKTINVTANNGNFDFTRIELEPLSTGITSYNNTALKVISNNDGFVLQSSIELQSVYLFNMQGQRVFIGQKNQGNWSLQSNQAGVYIISALDNAGNKYTKKVLRN